MSPGPTSLLRMPPDAGRGRPPAQSSIAFRFCIFCSLPLKGTPQHSRGVLQVGEGSMAREESRRVHVGQTAERAEPAKPEKITIGWRLLAFGAGSAAVLQTAASHRALVL